MHTPGLIQVSANCWKYTDDYGNCFYTKTSDPESEYHREDGPAIEIGGYCKEWYINGKLHREDGPAIEYANGNKIWFFNGKNHREDGPALEYANGNKEWYYNDQFIDVESQEEFEIYVKTHYPEFLALKE